MSPKKDKTEPFFNKLARMSNQGMKKKMEFCRRRKANDRKIESKNGDRTKSTFQFVSEKWRFLVLQRNSEAQIFSTEEPPGCRSVTAG